MIRLLPFILIPVLVLGSLWYWRSLSSKGKPLKSQEQQQPVEVPRSLPGASTEEKVKVLEEAIVKLSSQINNLKSANTQNTTGSSGSEINDLLAQVTELKARVSALEKTTPAPAAAGTKYPLYIPMGSAGGPWADQSWTTLTEYQATVNPDDYAGYSSMQLEVNFRLTEAAGTGSVRLYNVTDGSSISSQADTASTSFGIKSSGTFTLPRGSKTYTVQVKSSEGKQLFIQSARVKVNF